MGATAVITPSLVWGLLSCCFLCNWALGSQRSFRSLPPLPSQAQPGPGPTWKPPQGAKAALAFLYSGDVQQLSGANCSESYEVHGTEGSVGIPPVLQRAAGTLAQAANFLNMLLQANDIRESSVEEDVEWYQALVRSVVEGDPKAYRALLTFNPPPGASHLQLALQATRMGDETILQDLSGNRVQEENPEEDLDSPVLQKRVLTNDLRSLESPKWPRGDGYVGDIQQVKLSPPFLECHEGQLRPGWLVTVSATFYGLKPDLTPEVRGQVQMDIDLQSVDINQCASGPGWYSNTHLCDLNSTQCVPLESQGFVLGRYLCRCRPGFYWASSSGGLEESATQNAGQFGSPQGSLGKLLRCQPCPEGCTSCLDATPCLVEEALALRTAVLACQACCMLAVFLSMLVAYRCRRSKRIRASGIFLLETILFGSLLLYFPVFILYFKPSVFRCIALRWVRLLGFAVVYGTIILKLSRVLQLFLSRTAQRGPHPSSGQLLQRLGQLLLLVLGFLVVWTAGVLEPGIQHTPLVTQGHTPTGRHFYLCHHDHWDYIMVVAEMLLLCGGSFLCYATRAVPSAFHEPRYMGIALHNELLLSTIFHTVRFALVPSLHPDWTLLLFFLHTHTTVTATLALLFIPKFWKPGAPPREEILDEVYEEELELQRSGSYLNSSIASAWSERSLDPGDIRDELKKLYAQLEVCKTKEMTANNPHLPKKQSRSRQGLGRSLMRYLAEFPEALARQHSRDSGSPGHGSLPGSSRRRLLSSSIQETEKPPALRKTRSTYDHHREHNTPLLDSTLRRTLSKKASPSEGQAEGPPALGFRSASAHNLTVGERLPRARPISLQKSLSVVAGSREKALLVASQAYLEETYRQAKEREERKKAEAVTVSPVLSPALSPARRPSARRLERPLRAPLSAPPSPAKSSSLDSSHTPGKPQEEAGRRLPHPPIRHQVSTPILALSGACLGESRMLSPTPTSTLAPVLLPALAPTSTPVLAPVPLSPQSPPLLTFICPWENAELPGKKENVVQEGPTGSEQSSHLPASARTRIWRALSVAVEKRGAGESERTTEDGHVQGETADMDEDKPKVFSKSHSLKTPLQQGSVRSLGLAIKALTRSRSTYKEKEGGEDSPETEKGKPTGVSMGAPPRSPRLGRPKAVSKQAALSPCEDEESLQNKQNAHTSKMLHGCHREGSRGQNDRNKRASQGPGEQRVERTGKLGLATLRQVFGDKNAEQAKESSVGEQEVPNTTLQPLGSADHRVAEVCPWEVPHSGMSQSESSNKATVCPWEGTEGNLEKMPSIQVLSSSWEEREKAPEESEPRVVGAITGRKPERLIRSQEAVCPWENADPRGLSPQLAHRYSDRTQDKSAAVGSPEGLPAEAAAVGSPEGLLPEAAAVGSPEGLPPEAAAVGSPEGLPPEAAKAELCPWELRDIGEGTLAQRVKELPEERRKSPKKATLWREQNLGRDLVSLCPWESTDFRGPSAVSLQALGSSGSSGSGIAEVCPWESSHEKKAEVCPWELGAGTDTLNQGGDGEAASREGYLGRMGEQTARAKATVHPGQESVCPWEDAVPEQSSPHPKSSSSKAGEQFLSSGASQALQMCHWEEIKPEEKQAKTSTAEICPWEVDGRTGDRISEHTPKKEEFQKDGEKIPEKARIQTWGKTERQIQKQEAICPWESMGPSSTPQKDTEKPQAILQRQGSMGGKAAEIRPWDMEESLMAEKAKICPWEVGTGTGEERTVGAGASGISLNDTGQTSADSGPRQVAATTPNKSERPGLEKEVVCPWDSVGPGDSCQQPDTLSTEKPKDGLQDCVISRPTEVCPWGVEEVPISEKAKICPWDVNEGTRVKGLEQETESEPAEEGPKNLGKAGLPFQEGTPKGEAKLCQEQEEALCPWEDKDLRKPSAQVTEVSDLPSSISPQVAEGQSSEASDRATDMGVLREDPKMGSLPEHTTQGKAAALKSQFLMDGGGTSKELQTVCPLDSMGPPSSSLHPHSQCSDQPGASSQTLVSTGRRVAEVCPWDAPIPEQNEPDSDTKVELCPWKVTGRIMEPQTTGPDEKEDSQEEQERAPPKKPEHKGVAVQKTAQISGLGKQEAICPGESQDFGVQPATGASDGSKGSSEKVSCVGSSVAEVCPWEVEEVSSVKKAEICPWETSSGAVVEGVLDQGQDGESQGAGGAEERFLEAAETVYPLEGAESAELFPEADTLDTDHCKVSPHGACSPGKRPAELCQWEVTDPEGNKIKGTMADICPWEETRAPTDESGLLALPATQRDVPAAPEKSLCLSVHRPSESFVPVSKSVRPEVSKPPSAFLLEGVREQGPLGLEPGAKSAPEPSLEEVEAPKFSSLTGDQGQMASETQDGELSPPPAYPWDCE